MLSAVANEPRLKGKAYQALMNKFGKKTYQQSNKHALAAYMLASFLFTIIFIAVMFHWLSEYLQIYIGAGSWLLILLLSILLLQRIIKKIKMIRNAHERSIQYKQWKNRTLPQKEVENDSSERGKTQVEYAWRAALVILAAGMFFPYTYEVGGKFTIIPYTQQQIVTEIPGILENVNFEGGEIVPKGAVIGYLSHDDLLSHEKILIAKVNEQESLISELKFQPRAEELQVALNEVETQRVKTVFSQEKAERLQALYSRGTISLEDLEDARRNYEIDNKIIQEKIANYQLIKAGATQERIAAAESKLKGFQEELDHCREKIAK